MNQISSGFRRTGSLFAFVALIAFGAHPTGLHAQGTDNKEAIDAIVGSKVEEAETRTATDAAKVIAAIDKAAEATELVRKVSKLDKVEIVFLTDAAATEGGPPPEIQAKVDERKAEIAELRKELEGNAMLFHAIDSRQILMQDVLAVAFDGEQSVTIYTAGKPAG